MFKNMTEWIENQMRQFSAHKSGMKSSAIDRAMTCQIQLDEMERS